MNKYKEKLLFQNFKSSYLNFPFTLQEKTDGQDQPDSIIITTDNRKIGIELTEMYQDNQSSRAKGSELKKTEMVYQEIGRKIVENVVERYSKKFHLDISFHTNASFDQNTKQRVTEELSVLIIEYLPNLESQQQLIVSDFKTLPDEVVNFCIITNPKLTDSYFGISQSGAIRDLSNSHIETVLFDKHKAIENYEKCDEQWLVIQIGHFLAGSFNQNKIDKSFKSKFDKIFIHDIQSSKTIELKVEKYT